MKSVYMLACITGLLFEVCCAHQLMPVTDVFVGGGLRHCLISGLRVMISMQSTGQGGRHRLQPVHSDSITVCINFAAPTMASTGHACMHKVHPMQRLSSITTTVFGFSSPLSGFSG